MGLRSQRELRNRECNGNQITDLAVEILGRAEQRSPEDDSFFGIIVS
jgi:hypothetical protein